MLERMVATVFVVCFVANANAQSPPPAVDVTAAAAKAFIDKLPKDRISDLPSPARRQDV
jgi:hypothetical protein